VPACTRAPLWACSPRCTSGGRPAVRHLKHRKSLTCTVTVLPVFGTFGVDPCYFHTRT